MDCEKMNAVDFCGTDVKYENYGDGPVAMAGGTPAHSRTISNLQGLLFQHLKKNVCRLYQSDVKVAFANGVWVYPDLSVLCDRSKADKQQINGSPDLVVEVLSPATSRDDRKKKLPLYFENGAKEVWLVSYETLTVDVFTSVSEFETYRFLTEDDVAHLPEPRRAEVMVDRVESMLFPDFKPLLSDIFEDIE